MGESGLISNLISNILKGKKVLCLFPRFYTGGISKALSFVANTCDNAGMEVHCVAMTKQPETINLNKGIHRYSYDVTGKTGINRIISYALFTIKYRLLIRKTNPDVIIVFGADLVKATVYATWGLRIPIIGSERGNPLLYGRRFDKYRWAFSKASAIVFQTEMARDVYGVNVKTAIIPNPGITRHSANVGKGIKEGKNIISVSRLGKEKNIDGLIHAFALLKDQLPARKLILYGDGEEQAHLEQLSCELGINNQVLFAGNVNDFTQQNDDASIFVLNTLSEGMPNALIEAMVAGYACICTDCPIGAPRWLSDNGRRVKLVPVKDDIALSNAILEIATNREMADNLAKNALEIKELLSPERISKMWLNLISEVINEHN